MRGGMAAFGTLLGLVLVERTPGSRGRLESWGTPSHTSASELVGPAKLALSANGSTSLRKLPSWLPGRTLLTFILLIADVAFDGRGYCSCLGLGPGEAWIRLFSRVNRKYKFSTSFTL